MSTRRSTQATFVSSDWNRWSSVKEVSRSTARRSRYSGRSWCSTVATVACSRAMCDSMAIDRRSRKRRLNRSLSTPMIHVAAHDTASPTLATRTAVRSPSMMPSVRSLSHSASRTSGSIISTVVASEARSRRGSAW